MKKFQELRCGHPASMTEEGWEEIIDKIIYALERFGNDDWWLSDLSDEEYAKVEEGMELFGKYLTTLWW